MNRLVAPILLALVLTGCGDDTDPSGEGSWPPSTDPVDRSGLVYATGDTVHLGDGSTIGTDSAIEQFVLAGDGVFYVPASDEGTTGPLLLATPDGVTDTGAEAESRSLTPSPDGRYLAFIDLTTGEQDSFGTPVAEAVVVDLATGEEVVRSADGMGDPTGDDDLRDLYEDASGPEVMAVTEDTAYVATPDGVRSYDLATGERERVGAPGEDLRDEPWYPHDPDRTNPAGTWTIEDHLDGPPTLVPTDGGRAVVTSADYESWQVFDWVDDETAYGFGTDDNVLHVLITCTLPTGRCELVPGTEDGAQLPTSGLDL